MEAPLDILYLSQYFYPEQFLNNHIVRALAQRGHRVDVVCCVPNYPAGRFFDGYSNLKRKEEEWNGAQVHRVLTIPRGNSPVQLVLNYLVYPLAASWRLARLRPQPGAISFVSMPSPLFQAFAGIFAKRLWRIPTVFWVQDIWPDSAIITLHIRNRLTIRFLNALCSWIYRQGDLIMVQSDGFHRKIADFGVDPARIVTLPNAAPELFRPYTPGEIPQEIREQVPADRRTLMFAGNLGESQDFDTIIAAAKLLPDECDLAIVVIGSGRDEVRIREKVRQSDLQDRFVFLGRHPEDAMPSFFACADALLVSLRDEPIFALTVPSKVQAYLACGKPILASLRGEGAAIVESAQAGLVVPPSNPGELSRAMMQVASMPSTELAMMGARAERVYRECFSLDTVVDTLVIKLESVLNERAAASGLR